MSCLYPKKIIPKFGVIFRRHFNFGPRFYTFTHCRYKHYNMNTKQWRSSGVLLLSVGAKTRAFSTETIVRTEIR